MCRWSKPSCLEPDAQNDITCECWGGPARSCWSCSFIVAGCRAGAAASTASEPEHCLVCSGTTADVSEPDGFEQAACVGWRSARAVNSVDGHPARSVGSQLQSERPDEDGEPGSAYDDEVGSGRWLPTSWRAPSPATSTWAVRLSSSRSGRQLTQRLRRQARPPDAWEPGRADDQEHVIGCCPRPSWR